MTRKSGLAVDQIVALDIHQSDSFSNVLFPYLSNIYNRPRGDASNQHVGNGKARVAVITAKKFQKSENLVIDIPKQPKNPFARHTVT